MLKNMQIGPENFTFEPYDFHLMGILNVTPNSFSDGGRFNQLDKALFHTEELIKSGCRIIDIAASLPARAYAHFRCGRNRAYRADYLCRQAQV